MGEEEAIFFDAIVKGISARVKTLQNLKFDLDNYGYYWDEPFSGENCVFTGIDFAEKNAIKTLDVHFRPYYAFSERSRPEETKLYGLEPFSNTILPQLTNLKSLKIHFETELKEGFCDQHAFRFLSNIAGNMKELEDLYLVFTWNKRITQRIIEEFSQIFEEKDDCLPKLKNLHIDFNSCKFIKKENIKELQDALSLHRPEVQGTIIFNEYDRYEDPNEGGSDSQDDSDYNDNDSDREVGSQEGSGDKPIWERDDYEGSDDSDDSNEELSGFLDEEGNDDDGYLDFVQSLKA